MLTLDQIKPFLLHEDSEVRKAAVEYVTDSYARDPDFLPLLVESYERFGVQDNLWALSIGHCFTLTEASLDVVLEYLARAEDPNLIQLLNQAISQAPGDLLASREAAILANPGLDQDLVPRLQRRRDMASWPGEALWQELQDFARRSKDAHFVGDIDVTYADDLIDALGQRDVPDGATICRLLTELEPEEGWLEIFLVDLAGLRRLREAAPILVDKFFIDTDYLLERSKEALALIGEPEACRRIRSAFPTVDFSFKLFAASALPVIKHPESEETILALLETEEDPTIRAILCLGLCQLFSERGVEVVRREIAGGDYDTSFVVLEESLLPVLKVLGIELPETERWEKERENRRRLQAQRYAELEAPDRRYQALRADGINPFDPLSEIPPEPAPPDVATPIRRSERRVGRNDPCPCGSGKKFKKCCGRPSGGRTE